jgi:hypothetical protein
VKQPNAPPAYNDATIVIENENTEIKCSVCGHFIIEKGFVLNEEFADLSELSTYLYYHGRLQQIACHKLSPILICSNDMNWYDKQQYPNSEYVTPQIVSNWYPRTLTDKIDLFLNGLWTRASYPGGIYISRIMKFTVQYLLNVIEQIVFLSI